MKKLTLSLLLLPIMAIAAATVYKQPNDAIFYKTLKLPALGSSGVVINGAGGLLSSVAPGAAGNVLTSTGSVWASATPSGGFSSPMTTKGDLIGYSSSAVRIPVGATTGYVLTINPGATVGVDWEAAATGFSNPMTTTGDTIYSSSNSGTAARLGIGSSNSVLTVNSGLPSWGAIPLSSSNAVTSQLPLANGGTSINAGSTTALFSALSPMTTKGDIEYENSTQTGVTRLGIGSTNQAMFVSGGLPSWGTLPLGGGGTGLTPGSTTALFSALSPATAAGDLVYSNSTDTGMTRLGIGSSNSVLTVSGGLPSWQSVGLTANSTYAQAYNANGESWSVTSTTFADPTNSGGNALTVRASNNLTVTAAGGNLAGITFTPASSASVYLVLASTTINGTGTFQSFQLTDGTSVIDTRDYDGSANATLKLGGIYAPATGSPVTVKIQLASSSGSSEIFATGPLASAIEWTVIQINPPPTASVSLTSNVTGVLPLANGGTSVNAGSTTALFSALAPATTVGDILYENSTQTGITRLGIQANGSVLSIVGGLPAWTNATIAARYHASTNVILSSMSTISFNTEDYDTNNAYTAHAAANGYYTAPVTGYYHVNASLQVTDATLAAGNAANLQIIKNGAGTVYSATQFVGANASGKPLQLLISDIMQLNSGDTVAVQVSEAGTTPSIVSSNTFNYFSIALVH